MADIGEADRPRPTMTGMHRVLVLGGGFGGIAAAVALRERLDPADEVVLVERRPTFVMGLRKNWALVGSSTLAEGERSLASLGDRGIRVVPGTIESIDAGKSELFAKSDPGLPPFLLEFPNS